MTTAFELHILRAGQWQILSVFKDKDIAIHEAREMFDERPTRGIRVIEERYDPGKDVAQSTVIYQAVTEPPKPPGELLGRNRPRKEAAPSPPVCLPEEPRGSALRYVILLVLSLGGIGLAGLLGLAFLADYLR
jgi:hypothetical protein